MTSKRKVLVMVVVIFLIVSGALLTYFMPNLKMSLNAKKYELKVADLTARADRIYFLNTGGADAILVESEGKFALIDGAEDSDNPRGFPELVYEGTEQYVLDAVKKIAGDENGKAELEFILGTHSHSDHIGGLDTLVLDEDITVKTVYIKKYDESIIRPYEIEAWDNKEVFEQLMDACKKRNVPVVHDISEEKFDFGNFTMKFCNTAEPASTEPVGENENAVGLLIEKNGKRAFLSADINNLDGDEDRLSEELGKIDLLKVGHHGYDNSTTLNYVEALRPQFAVVTNKKGKISRTPLKNLNSVNVAIFETGNYGGIVAEFKDDSIELFCDIDKSL